MTKRICNKCGKEFDIYDDFHLEYRFGYGSIKDGEKLEIDLCCSCLDELTESLISNFKYSPIAGNCFNYTDYTEEQYYQDLDDYISGYEDD